MRVSKVYEEISLEIIVSFSHTACLSEWNQNELHTSSMGQQRPRLHQLFVDKSETEFLVKVVKLRLKVTKLVQDMSDQNIRQK